MQNKFRAPIGRTLLNAIAEFKELEEHYNFLKCQHDGLVNSQFIIVTHFKRTMARAAFWQWPLSRAILTYSLRAFWKSARNPAEMAAARPACALGNRRRPDSFRRFLTPALCRV